MVQPPIYEIDADGTIRTDALHWEGFPCILWETLSELGYTTPPLYEVVSFWDQDVPYARMTATVLPHPEHPEWAYLSMMFFAHHSVESVESAAMRILHTICEQHPDKVMLTTQGLFPAMDPLDPAWRERISLTDVLLTTDPPEVIVRQLLRLLEAVYNMQVFRLSTQGMLSVVLDSAAMRDILTLDLQFEQQTVAHLHQDLVALQDERIQWHQERVEFTEQLHARDHALEMTQAQLAHTEAQRFALVQNVAEMQNQVAEMEIEVEVWQAMAHQGQQPPIAPPAAPAAPDELQGASGLSEDSVGSPPPASPDTSCLVVIFWRKIMYS
jgi:hypothetical protein